MMRLESPLVSPQEIGIVDILFGFQPNTFFDQVLMGRNREFSARISTEAGYHLPLSFP
jgi:hypothetical protein